MDLICKMVHKIDYDGENITEISTDESFDNFAYDLIQGINENVVTKEYAPTSQTTQVVANVKKIINITMDESNEAKIINRASTYMIDIANRLLNKEMEKQDQIMKMGKNVKKGSLIQAAIREKDSLYYLLAKVEHTSFVDDADFLIKTGFSSEQKKIWKTCIFDCEVEDDEITINNAHIYLNTPAKYWASDFLELREVSTDSENTKRAFRSVDALLKRDLKKKAPSDYTIIRNSIVWHMKKEIQLDYNNMINSIFEGYVPEIATEEDIESLREKMLQLPEKKKFERLFTVVPKEIKAKIKQIYQVNDGIEIKVNGYIEDIKETISAYEDNDTGTKYIKIRTNNNDVYKQFQ